MGIEIRWTRESRQILSRPNQTLVRLAARARSSSLQTLAPLAAHARSVSRQTLAHAPLQPMHVPLGYFPSVNDACAAAPPPNSISLNGTWKFDLAKNPHVCFQDLLFRG